MTALLSDFQRHLTVLSGSSASTASSYAAKVSEFIQWLDRKKRPTSPASITQQDVEDYMEYCYYQGNANETRLTKLIALTRFFRFLKYKGLVTADVTALIPRPRLRSRTVQKFMHEEVLRILAAIDITGEKGLRDACIVVLAVMGGLRAGEIVGLALQDVTEREDGWLDFHVTGKFSKEREVDLWKAPSELVRRWLSVRMSHGARARDPVFVTYHRGGRHHKNALRINDLPVMIHEYARAAGVRKPKISMHMLRATHASDLRSIERCDSHFTAKRLGHASTATTDRYIPDQSRIRKVYPSLDAYWGEFKKLWREGKDNDQS